MNVCVACVHWVAWEDEEDKSDHLLLELQMAVSIHVGAGNWIEVLCKSRGAVALSHNFIPYLTIYKEKTTKF